MEFSKCQLWFQWSLSLTMQRDCFLLDLILCIFFFFPSLSCQLKWIQHGADEKVNKWGRSWLPFFEICFPSVTWHPHKYFPPYVAGYWHRPSPLIGNYINNLSSSLSFFRGFVVISFIFSIFAAFKSSLMKLLDETCLKELCLES